MKDSKENNLNLLLRYADLSSSDLAKQLGISKQQVNQWLKQERPIPAKHIESIAQILGIKESILFSPTLKLTLVDDKNSLVKE